MDDSKMESNGYILNLILRKGYKGESKSQGTYRWGCEALYRDGLYSLSKNLVAHVRVVKISLDEVLV